MDRYEVRFSVDGRPGGSVIVEAYDSSMARRIAQGEIMGKPGYAGKKISIQSPNKLR